MAFYFQAGFVRQPALRLLVAVGLLAGVVATAYFAKTPAPSPAVKLPWTDNYAAALKQAKAENKKILLNFTGSDWCVNCFRLEDEIFSRPEFARYALSQYVLVTLDFPIKKELPENVATQNDALRLKYEVSGLPTLVLLDAGGKKLNQIVGYDGSGLKPFLAKLDKDYPEGAKTAAPAG